MKYPKEYTQKEWSKFSSKQVDASSLGNDYQFFNFFTQKLESYESMSVQEMMIIKYDIVLTDYKTKKEKIFNIIDKVNIKNLNSGIEKFNKGVNQFSKAIESSTPGKGPSTRGLTSNNNKLGISQREYDKLFKPKRRKGNSVNFWDEDQKTRKRRNKKRKAVQPDYSFITGKRKTKFF